MRRDLMVKLYVDEKEQSIIWELARANGTNVNRYLRELLYDAAIDYGVPDDEAKSFQRIYVERGEKHGN